MSALALTALALNPTTYVDWRVHPDWPGEAASNPKFWDCGFRHGGGQEFSVYGSYLKSGFVLSDYTACTPDTVDWINNTDGLVWARTRTQKLDYPPKNSKNSPRGQVERK